MRIGWLVLVVALAGSATLAQGGEFSYSESVYADLDPAGIRSPHDERLVLALFEPLTTIDAETGEVAPGAADRWQVSPDGRTWTFSLRPTARWSDGTPVRAQDFIEAWRRALDPYEPSHWAWAFRPIEGCARISDGTEALNAVGLVRSRLKDLVERDASATIPGGETRALLARSGLARYAGFLEDDLLKQFVATGGKDLPPSDAAAVLKALKAERRRLKKSANAAFDAFGTSLGVMAAGDKTLTVRVARPCPWLPALLSRGMFAPLTAKTVRGSNAAFLPGELVSNGPFLLKGRGAKPHASVPNPLSVVHLIRNPKYEGPRSAVSDEVLCYTGQGAEEDLRRLEAGELQWLSNPVRSLGARTAKLDGFQEHPGSGIVLLRFRCDRPPFDRLEVRRAFADSVRDAKLETATWPVAQPAARLVPPTLAGATGPQQERRGAGKAKAALEKAGLGGDAFPWVELRYVERGDEEDIADRLLEVWEKRMGVELGLRIGSADEMAATVRAGAYAIALDRIDALVADPEAFVFPFSASEADGGTGWKDATFEALIDAARDPAAFVAGGDAALEALKDVPGLGTKASAARGKGAGALEALRIALLEAAETRLLDAYVVVPILFPKRAFVVRGGQGIGSRAAWKNPAFVGALPSAP